MKPTKEQFLEFRQIRDSGVTNMIDFEYITAISNTGLTREICLYIIQYFGALQEEFVAAGV